MLPSKDLACQRLAEQVKSLLKSEGIALYDKEKALASIEECVGKTMCKHVYLTSIYPVEIVSHEQ